MTASFAGQSNSNQLVYLLSKDGFSSILKRYRFLRDAFEAEGEFLSLDAEAEWLACYESDGQQLHTRLPLLVFRPYTVDVIASFIRTCYAEKIPIKVRCGGTSLTGASVAAPEGVVLLTGHLNEIVDYQSQTGSMIVEPGVTPNQLNTWVEQDGWWFPLEMATNGVAGLAGCLSCQSKGYHQSGRSLFGCIQSVTIVDGKGESLEVSPWLICGTEALFGVVIQIKLQLMRKPKNRAQAICTLSWQEIFFQLPFLRHYQALVGLSWRDNQFIFHLEGDNWRIIPTLEYLAEHCRATVLDSFLPPFYPKRVVKRLNIISISSACSSFLISKGVKMAEEYAHELKLDCLCWADIWFGAIHMQLSSDQDSFQFSQSLSHFFLLWIEWLESVQGFLMSAHGIGKLLRPYLPPFMGEEEIRFLKLLQESFDPMYLFEKDHFFPEVGKSVEQRFGIY